MPGHRMSANRSRVWRIETAVMVSSYHWASGPVLSTLHSFVCVVGRGVVTLPMLHIRKLREADLPDIAQLVKEVRMKTVKTSQSSCKESTVQCV